MGEYVNIDSGALMRPSDYTGRWEVYWPNGNVKYRGRFVGGVEVGQHVCFWEDGTVAQITWRDSLGYPRGTAVSFYPDGDKEVEETWDNDSRHAGSFERRCYDANGDVFLRTTYCEFDQVDSWSRDASEERTEADDEIDKIVDDAVRNVQEIYCTPDDDGDD